MEYENKKEKYKNAIRNWRQSKTIKRTIEINFTDNANIMKPEPVKQEKISPKNDDKILKAKIKEWKVCFLNSFGKVNFQNFKRFSIFLANPVYKVFSRL